MASEYQEKKKQNRLDRLQNQREQRKLPREERQLPLGLGVNRKRIQAERDNKKITLAGKESSAKKETSPHTMASSTPAIMRKDSIEISIEALKRYQETRMLAEKA